MVPFEGYRDSRGFFCSPFSTSLVNRLNLKEFYVSVSKTIQVGTIRGMHFQDPPFCETKLVAVVQGSILDVVVDLDISKPLEERIKSYEMSQDDDYALFIPQGFAHGYQALTDDVIVLYGLDSSYNRRATRGYSPLSPVLSNMWPKIPRNIKAEDLNWPDLV